MFELLQFDAGADEASLIAANGSQLGPPSVGSQQYRAETGRDCRSALL